MHCSARNSFKLSMKSGADNIIIYMKQTISKGLFSSHDIFIVSLRNGKLKLETESDWHSKFSNLLANK